MAAGQGMKEEDLADLGHNKDFRLSPKSSKKQLKGWETGLVPRSPFFFFFFPIQKCGLPRGQKMEVGSQWIWGHQLGGYCDS